MTSYYTRIFHTSYYTHDDVIYIHAYFIHDIILHTYDVYALGKTPVVYYTERHYVRRFRYVTYQMAVVLFLPDRTNG